MLLKWFDTASSHASVSNGKVAPYIKIHGFPPFHMANVVKKAIITGLHKNGSNKRQLYIVKNKLL